MKIDIELLKKFEQTLDTVHPERGKIPIEILGYGEISLVFSIKGQNIAYKRIPIFDDEIQVKRHIWAYNMYNQLLQKIGLILPEYDVAFFKDKQGKIQFYCIQEMIAVESVGNIIIHNISVEEVKLLVLLALREMKKVWDFNLQSKTFEIALDGQISNFAVLNYDSQNSTIEENTKLQYLDTSTPLFRVNGKEAMEPELLLKSAPSFLRWLLKTLFLQDTVDRYYDFRRVIIDLIANFYKEQLPHLIPSLIDLANQFLQEEASEHKLSPIEGGEIYEYYKSDANMWDIFQRVRKLDRWIHTKILRKKYPFYLPADIQR
ncbi:MAG: hypothetical protein BAJALOKI1v1_1760005 [Promethearchaeota archaeon]|nr:MAG: hypothetical protein BAJALOKI1v1_1760005 [Candidatus Lokiarchaeota archaeon]